MPASTSDNQSSHAACAACRYQRKKCAPNCLLRRHFPASDTAAFAAVHKVFGVANVIKMMRDVESITNQDKLAASLHWEATAWAKDSIRGPLGAYTHLQEENHILMQKLSSLHQQLLQMMRLPSLPPHVNNNYNQTPQVNNNYNHTIRSLPPNVNNNYNQTTRSLPPQVNNNYNLPPIPMLDQQQQSIITEEYDRAMVPFSDPITTAHSSWQQQHQYMNHQQDWQSSQQEWQQDQQYIPQLDYKANP